MACLTDTLLPTAIREKLTQLASEADQGTNWPMESWHLLCKAGVTAWSIPISHGGDGLAGKELLVRYEELASVCLTTAFILSQREAAIRRLGSYPGNELPARYLPPLARGEIYATVGLSQLTTSRQHQGPSLLARPIGPIDQPEAYRIDGLIPWVTGADQAAIVIVGAVLPDQRQILLVLPAGWSGVSLDPPLSLLALAGSRTAQIRCDGVVLPVEYRLGGPAEKVLAVGGGGVGGLETSCLALGLTKATVDYLMRETTQRVDIRPMAEQFQQELNHLRDEMYQLAEGNAEETRVVSLRVQSTRLVLQTTQAALTIAKGAGFVSPHPVERWVRQALFFLVWSCPRSVSEGLLMQWLGKIS